MSGLQIDEQLLIEQLRRVLAQERPRQKLKAGEVDKMLGGSRTSGWITRKRPDFPRPIVIGHKLKLWDRDEVLVWLEAQREAG